MSGPSSSSFLLLLSLFLLLPSFSLATDSLSLNLNPASVASLRSLFEKKGYVILRAGNRSASRAHLSSLADSIEADVEATQHFDPVHPLTLPSLSTGFAHPTSPTSSLVHSSLPKLLKTMTGFEHNLCRDAEHSEKLYHYLPGAADRLELAGILPVLPVLPHEPFSGAAACSAPPPPRPIPPASAAPSRCVACLVAVDKLRLDLSQIHAGASPVKRSVKCRLRPGDIAVFDARAHWHVNPGEAKSQKPRRLLLLTYVRGGIEGSDWDWSFAACSTIVGASSSSPPLPLP